MIFHFILEIVVKQNGIFKFEPSAVTELRFTSKGDIYSVIITFPLAVLQIFSIRQKFSYISLIYKKSPFFMELILPKNISKAPKRMENVNIDGNKKVRQ